MEINAINFLGSDYMQQYASQIQATDEKDDSFGAIFHSLINTVNETNDLQNAAESAEIQFALGQAENTHDLLIAEQKAAVALQYTVAIRDRLLDAYNQIMQMQI